MTMTMTRDLWIASMTLGCALFLAGCPKSSEGDKNAPPPPAGDAATTSATTDAAASAATADAGASEQKAASYEGTYKLVPATYYIPSTKDYASVRQAKDDPTQHVGEGTLKISVDETGRVSGTIDTGPASPAIVDGMVIEGEIRGNVRRKDPSDDGLTGTLVAKISGNGAEGTLSLAEARAAVVREGKLSLEKK